MLEPDPEETPEEPVSVLLLDEVFELVVLEDVPEVLEESDVLEEDCVCAAATAL